ncbi:MAG: Flp pilus assembly complex ATPase component TadA [Alphaproteobacteria bacterium]|nr:Flp pilus assembly complex ATPase component TadA [Alphaproteobacteria bacterium]
MRKNKVIGEIFLERGLVSQEQISAIANKKSNRLFGQKAVELGLVSEEDLVNILSEIYRIETVSLEFLYIREETLKLLKTETAVQCCAIAFFEDENAIKVAIADPGDIVAIDKIRSEIKFKSQTNGTKPNESQIKNQSPKKEREVKFFIAKESEILRFIEIMKSDSELMEFNPLILLNKIIFKASERKASDIHFEPMENLVRVRFRIDGILKSFQIIEKESWNRIQSRLKLIANLDITENRRPQSGHTRIHLAGKIIDLRISTHPGIFGENFVIRIFDLSSGIKSLAELNFDYDDFCWLKKAISHPNGILLIIGPTGAGKTTTLYSLLQSLNSSDLNIMTLEDPVEYQIEGIRQLDIQEEGIVTFADGIKSILRQDPDIILIGEIRDESTAAMAVRASLTGRLVIATLHAATPLEGIRRLQDFKLNLSDFIPSLIGIFSQRLVRYKKGSGYRERFPISEYVFFSEQLKNKILSGDLNFELDKTFETSAKNAVSKNLTDIQEIKRVLGHEKF